MANSFKPIRRKANKQTLRQADDSTPFDEAVWQAALEGVEREGFLRMFGIDHARLREAGREIAEGKGKSVNCCLPRGRASGHLRSLQEQLQQPLD
ncbi:MAG: AAA family ATPase [Planctomycetaceae bacterium]